MRLNLCFLRPTQVDNPNDKLIGSAIFTQLMAECRRAPWHHPANTIELVLPLAHPSPQPKQQADQLNCFCTAHGRQFLYFTTGAPFSQNCPFPRQDLDPIEFMIPWAHPNPQPKWHLDRFSHFCRAYYCGRLTDRPTDRPHYTVGNNKPHLHM